jgi:hypothetical protein
VALHLKRLEGKREALDELAADPNPTLSFKQSSILDHYLSESNEYSRLKMTAFTPDQYVMHIRTIVLKVAKERSEK